MILTVTWPIGQRKTAPRMRGRFVESLNLVNVATVVAAARNHDDARRAMRMMRASHVMAAMHAAMTDAVTVHALRGSGNGGEHRRGGGNNQS